VSKLHIKFIAFTAHLPLKVQGSFKELSSACRVLGKLPVRIENMRRFFHAAFFQSKMFYKLVPGCVLRPLKDFSVTKSA